MIYTFVLKHLNSTKIVIDILRDCNTVSIAIIAIIFVTVLFCFPASMGQTRTVYVCVLCFARSTRI